MADLIAGGNDRDFFPRVVLVFEESAPRVVNDGDDGLGHLHFFLFAGGTVVFVGKVFQNPLKGSVSQVARTDPGLSAQNVVFCGDPNPGVAFSLGNSYCCCIIGGIFVVRSRQQGGFALLSLLLLLLLLLLLFELWF